MIYELINPSDHITLVADSLEAAALTVVLLGQGWYGLSDEEGKTVVAILSGEEWFQEQFGASVADCMHRSEAAVAACLRSLAYGNRADFEAGLAECADSERRAAFTAAWDNRKRSSLKNIKAQALRLAAGIEAKAAAAVGGAEN